MRIALAAALAAGLFAPPASAHREGDHAPTAEVAAAPAAATPGGDTLPFDVGGPFSLVDHTGRPRSRDDFRGEYRIVYFGYTQCPNTCSTAMATIAAALDDLAAGGDDLGALFITIDPAYDTPARLADYVARIHPRLVGLTGDAAEIERVQRAYQVQAREVADKGEFARLFEHQPMAYLMGPEGDILTLFPPILPPARLAAIVRGYLP